MTGSNRHLIKKTKTTEVFHNLPNDTRSELERIVDTYKIGKSKPKFRLLFGKYLERYQDQDMIN